MDSAMPSTKYIPRRVTGLASIMQPIAFIAIAFYLLWPKYLTIPNIGVNPYSLLMILSSPVFMFRALWLAFIGGRASGSGIFAITLLLAYLLSDLLSICLGGVDASFADYLRSLFQVKLLFFVGFYLGSKEQSERVVLVLLLSSFIICFIGFWEFATSTLLADFFLKNVRFLISADLTNLTEARVRDGFFRAQAVLDHPIVFGSLCAALMPISIYSIRFRYRGLIFLLPILMGGVYISGSRAAFVSAVLAVFLYITLTVIRMALSGRPTPVIFMVILSIFLSPLVVGYMYDMIIGRSAVERVSNNLRSIMWESAWPYFYKSPILGWGEGSAANFVGLYLSSTKTVDDSYLSMLLNGGISGVFLFFAFFIVVLFRLIIARVDESDRFLNAAWFSSIVAVLVCQKITSIPFLFGLAYLLAGVSVVRSLK